jgi:hypothetical protein
MDSLFWRDSLLMPQSTIGHFSASYQNLTKILPKSYDFYPWPPILHLLQSQQSSAMESIHSSGRCRQPALWLGNFVSKRTCNSAMVIGRVGHVDRVERRPTHLWEELAEHEPYARGTDWLKELPACTMRIQNERHAGSTEATAGEEKHIGVRIEVSDQDISSSRTGRKENACLIRQSTDPEQDTVSLGMGSRRGRCFLSP